MVRVELEVPQVLQNFVVEKLSILFLIFGVTVSCIAYQIINQPRYFSSLFALIVGSLAGPLIGGQLIEVQLIGVN